MKKSKIPLKDRKWFSINDVKEMYGLTWLKAMKVIISLEHKGIIKSINCGFIYNHV